MDTANIKLTLKTIEELGSASVSSEIKNIDDKTLDVRLRTKTIVCLNADEIKVTAGVKYCNAGTDILIVEVALVFTISNLNKAVNIDTANHKIQFKVDLIPTLLNVAVGTLRGIVYEKAKQTPLMQYPIPLVDGNKLLNNNTMQVQ